VDRVRVEVLPGVVMELDEGDYVNRKILFDGGYELATLRLFDRLLATARGFTDIGAHHGQYTLRAARALAGRGRVVCFEPTPATAARLVRNAQLSALTNIDLYSFALSDAGGIARMVLQFANNTGGAHLAPGSADGEDDLGVRLHVAVRPFSDVAPEIPAEALDVVKVDVEGHEKRVLSDLLASARSKPRHLILEFFPEFFDYGLPQGMPAWLQAQGYVVRTVEGQPYRPGESLPDNNLWAEWPA
jgi:FkbM family methyltransferase